MSALRTISDGVITAPSKDDYTCATTTTNCFAQSLGAPILIGDGAASGRVGRGAPPVLHGQILDLFFT